MNNANNHPFNSNKNQQPFPTRVLVLLGTFLLLFGAVFAVFYFNPWFEQIHLERLERFGGPLVYIGFALLAGNVGFLLYTAFLYFRYKAVEPLSDEELPKCTVIVPAYNEGELVYETLTSLVQSDYPKDKLQIISIDDGSQDDTWNWMEKAKFELGDRVDIFQQPENKGKRHALHRGFHLATGEVFITVDSDSVVEKDTLRNMASPLCQKQGMWRRGGECSRAEPKGSPDSTYVEREFCF